MATNERQAVVSLAAKRQTQEVLFTPDSPAVARHLQRRAAAGELLRLSSGVYILNGPPEEVEARVARNWQALAGRLVPGAVVSHLSAFTRGLTEGRYVTLSHPTRFNRVIKLPGVELVLLKGPGQLPGDMALGDTGIFWASQPRALLENLGRVVRRRPTRAGRDAVEEKLVAILNASGENVLNRVRDEARHLAPALDAEKAFAELNSLVGALLKTHSKGELRTKLGQLVASGTPVDVERMGRLELLASALRSVVLPAIADVASAGEAKVNFAFLESYFSNYVEGTKFSIEEAEGIVLKNEVIASRPKDSHDILGVFNLAINPGTRDSLPPPGEPFVEGLRERHRAMLSLRPEVNPGELKTEVNYAGTTRFVEPGFVRGTLQEGSSIALSVPEGLARAIFYAFLVSEVHPFEDGNGRVSRLMMNAELSRLGLCRIIIPTIYHPQYVDCQRALTRSNEPDGYIKALKLAAQWCAQFDYSKIDSLIQTVRATNALEESPVAYHLLNKDGSKMA
jgi:hypothetical protein